MEYIFLSFHFIYLCLDIKWICYTQVIVGSCFLFFLTVFLFIREFNSLTFNLITDRERMLHCLSFSLSLTPFCHPFPTLLPYFVLSFYSVIWFSFHFACILISIIFVATTVVTNSILVKTFEIDSSFFLATQKFYSQCLQLTVIDVTNYAFINMNLLTITFYHSVCWS